MRCAAVGRHNFTGSHEVGRRAAAIYTLAGDVMYGVPTPEDREMNDGRKVKLSTALASAVA